MPEIQRWLDQAMLVKMSWDWFLIDFELLPSFMFHNYAIVLR